MSGNLKIPYGVSDFRRIRNEGFYYVDKTRYLARMEERDSFIFFVRPRRFGKSLFLSMMECYYDKNRKGEFEKLFGGLWLGEHPTENANRYMMLKLDFSKVGGTGEELERAFEQHISDNLEAFVARYPECYDREFVEEYGKRPVDSKFASAVNMARLKDIPLYLIIDEYDNFTNQMIRATGVQDYRDITHGAGFYRNWFKKFKGDFDRIFMTGVSPVTMDDLTSGFNIAANLTLDAEFNAALGFTEAEVLKMYSDFKGTGAFTEGDPAEIVAAIKPWYDGYYFAKRKIGTECVFNADMTLYHLKNYVATGEHPENLVDVNIRTDYEKLKTVVELQRAVLNIEGSNALPITEKLVTTGGMQFELVESFPVESIIKPQNFHSLFFYYGLLSMVGKEDGEPVFGVPNACVQRQMCDYLRNAYMPPGKDWSEWEALARRFALRGEWRPFLDAIASNYGESVPVRGSLGGEYRLQGYHQAEFGHVKYFLAAPELELSHGFCDFLLFPDNARFENVAHSYIIEFKYAKKGARKSELEAQRAEGIDQLKRYAKDAKVPALARGTTLHLILVQYRGPTMANCELVGERQY